MFTKDLEDVGILTVFDQELLVVGLMMQSASWWVIVKAYMLQG